MSIRPFRDIKRRKTKKIKVGKIEIGGDAPISVQSMTNTLTTDVEATIKQINELSEAGADIIRVSCPDQNSSLALKKILKHIEIPIVADIHFHYKRAISGFHFMASSLVCAKIQRINVLCPNTIFGHFWGMVYLCKLYKHFLGSYSLPVSRFFQVFKLFFQVFPV